MIMKQVSRRCQMGFQEDAVQLYNEGIIGTLILLGVDGQIYWTLNDWPVDGNYFLNIWYQKPNAIMLGESRFSVIDKGEDRFVCTSVRGEGHFIMAKCPFWNGFLVSWCPQGFGPSYAYAQIAKLAGQIR